MRFKLYPITVLDYYITHTHSRLTRDSRILPERQIDIELLS